jgi:cell wall-associated NlpC family hydrolase
MSLIRVIKYSYCFLFILLLDFNLSAQEVQQDSLSVNNLSPKKNKLDFNLPEDSIPENSNDHVNLILSFAKTFLGTPYISSGASPTGFDCSGFISYVLGNFGLSVIHSSYGMAEYGRTVKLSEAKPGDLMFFKGRNVNSTRIGHVAMILDVSEEGEIKFIHAASSKGISIDKFNGNGYYVPRYVTTKRLDYGVEKP